MACMEKDEDEEEDVDAEMAEEADGEFDEMVDKAGVMSIFDIFDESVRRLFSVKVARSTDDEGF